MLRVEARHSEVVTPGLRKVVATDARAAAGPGGKTTLPHRAVAKIDMRLVPDMTAKETLELLKSHLQRKGFGDVEVNMTGGYDPTETPADSRLVKAMAATYRKVGVEPLLWPRLAGSWPGGTVVRRAVLRLCLTRERPTRRPRA
jgi:acetylornithine deacetylase/succinyl-diaminopimelate desuccinylase-like protein